MKTEPLSARCRAFVKRTLTSTPSGTRGAAGRFARFAVIGLSGVVVNMGVLVALTDGLGIAYALSSLFAIEISILSNFALNNSWTWADRSESPLLRRLLKYHAAAGLTALAVNWLLLVFLTRAFSIDYRLSNFVGIAAGVAVNFLLNHYWTFALPRRAAGVSSASEIFGNARVDADASPTADDAARFGRLRWVALGVLTLLTLAKIVFAAKAELLPEEAYYWTYWQHPALAYFDHPPMVAWMVGLGTSLWGDTELGVRFGAILLSLGSTAFVFLLGRLWFGAQEGWWSMFLFMLLPLFIAIGVLAFPDAPLIFFWLVTLWAISKALQSGVPKEQGVAARARGGPYWLLAGAAAGAALLSKYTAVMLLPSLLLFLLCSPTHRRWLRRPEPWLAAFVALLIFSPVILWNAQNAWASFRFQSGRTEEAGGAAWRTAGEFWLLQLLILGPAFVILARGGWREIWKAWMARDDFALFSLSFFLPLFLVFVAASFKTNVHLNWTAPAFCSLIPAAAALLHAGWNSQVRARARRCRWMAAAISGTAAALVIAACAIAYERVPDPLIPSRVGGWRSLAKAVRDAQQNSAKTLGETPFVLGADKYNLAAELGFYLRAPNETVNNLALCKTALGYRYWTDLKAFEGRPAIIVLKKPETISSAELRQHFKRVDPPHAVEIAAGKRTRKIWLAVGYEYRTHQPIAGQR